MLVAVVHKQALNCYEVCVVVFFPFQTLIMYSLAQNFNRLLTIYTVNQILQSGIQILPQFGSNLVFQLYLLLNTPIHWPHANYTPLTSHL